jgi:drug/metabolite transporter (DMT)-like permease
VFPAWLGHGAANWSAFAALLAFSANSLLCRSALGDAAIDAASFTWIRLASGALGLAILIRLVAPDRSSFGVATPPAAQGRREWPERTAWAAAAALVTYASAFSFAYLRLGAGTGALVLFATTQLTMIGGGLMSGERPRRREWLGVAIALLGLVALTTRGRTSPDPVGVALMALAGLGWGAYSLLGRTAADPIAANAMAFLRGGVLFTPFALLPLTARTTTPRGIVLAALSGALASGLGYCLWYRALPHLSRVRAAAVQLSVPVITAAAGTLLLGEAVTLRLALSSAVILGGVALVMTSRRGPPVPAEVKA